MGRTLGAYTGYRRSLRTAFAWTVVGLSTAGEAFGLYLDTQNRANAGVVLALDSPWLVNIALLALPSGRLDEIRRFYELDRATGRPAALVAADVAAMWRGYARSERKWRLVAGWLEALLPATALGLEVAIDASAHAFTGGGLILLGTLGAAPTALALFNLTTPGQVESSWRSYERATGHGPGGDGSALQPGVACVPGGGVVGIGGRF